MIPFSFHGHNKPVTALRFSEEGDLLFTGSKDGLINVYNTTDGERVGTYNGHRSILDLALNRSTTLMASAGMDFKTNLWEVTTGKLQATIEAQSIVRCVGFSHDDQQLLTVTDKMRESRSCIAVFNLPQSIHRGAVLSKPPAELFRYSTFEKIMYAQWGPTNDTIYFGSDDGSVCILDVETQQEIRGVQPHRDEVRRINFDRNYFTLVSASKDKSAKLLDMRTLQTIQTYEAEMPINDANISPTADHVVLAGGTEAQDVTTTSNESAAGGGFGARFYHKVYGDLLGHVNCHFGTIHRVAFHPKGTGFATGAEDGFAKLHMFESSYNRSPGATPCWVPSAERREEEDEEEDEELDEDEEQYEEDGDEAE